MNKLNEIFDSFFKSAETLEKERGSIDELILKWDGKLKDLDLKVETWVCTDEEEPTSDDRSHKKIQLGFREGLVVRMTNKYGSEVEPLEKVNYEVKIEALLQLSKLLVDIRILMNEQIAKIQRMKDMTDFEVLRKHLKIPLISNHSPNLDFQHSN